MSNPKATAPDSSPAYYASGSYQQGGNGMNAGGSGAPKQTDDDALARRLQQEEFRNAQALPTVTGHPMRTSDGTQYVTMYPPSNAFDPADLGVSGNFIAPHEVRLMEAFALGRTIRFLAILDGLILLLNCAWFPVLFLLILWAPISGWMAGTRYSTGWTYAYCAYYVMRLSMDLAYIILGYYWFLFMCVINLVIARYIFRFAKVLNALTPAEIEQLRNPSAVWSSQYRRQPFMML